jgi:hypothetical protein
MAYLGYKNALSRLKKGLSRLQKYPYLGYKNALSTMVHKIFETTPLPRFQCC